MDRKEFLKATLAAIGTTAVLPVLNNNAVAQTAPADKERKFRDFWVTTMMSSMDSSLTPEERMKIMEANGRACARRNLARMDKQKNIGVDALVAALGEKTASRKGNEVTLTFDKCSCPLVGSGPERLSDTWCFCSSGWVKEVFENATGKKVTVEIKQAIKRRDPVCRLVAQLA
jgi:hypothetical protein